MHLLFCHRFAGIHNARLLGLCGHMLLHWLCQQCGRIRRKNLQVSIKYTICVIVLFVKQKVNDTVNMNVDVKFFFISFIIFDKFSMRNLYCFCFASHLTSWAMNHIDNNMWCKPKIVCSDERCANVYST